MKLKSFLGVVEIRTKVASMIPMLLGTIYTVYRYNRINIINLIIFVLSLILIDMVTTALNNYFDYKRANRKEGYNYERHNAIVRDRLKESSIIFIIIAMFTVSVCLGVFLVYRTNILVLLIGIVSFTVGIGYSLGPVPISKTPFGEAFSGFFMGFVILFLSVYIHIFDMNIVKLSMTGPILYIKLSIQEVLFIFLFSIPSICGIANIMLANNICDMEEDIINKRYTLPIYIGRKAALILFKSLFLASYITVIVLLILRLIPFICAFVLVTFIPVYKNIKQFMETQSKKETFPISVKSFFIFSLALIFTFGIGVFIKLLH